MGVSTFSIILLFAEGYSRDICRVFVEYSWDIRMYRVCVGYVSGMYRESVEAYKVRMGGFDKLVERNRSSWSLRSRNLNKSYYSATCSILRTPNELPPLLAMLVRLILSKCGGNNTKCQLVYKFLKTYKERWALKTPKLFQLKNLRNRIFFCTFAADFVRICAGRACEQLKREI